MRNTQIILAIIKYNGSCSNLFLFNELSKASDCSRCPLDYCLEQSDKKTKEKAIRWLVRMYGKKKAKEMIVEELL